MLNKYKKHIARWVLALFALTTVSSSITLADDYMYVKAAHLNVRSVWSIKGKIVATIDSWYKVTVLESLSNWWKKVLLENGQTGYVNSSYLVAWEPAYEKVSSARYTIKSWDAFLRWFDLVKKVAVLSHWDTLEVTSEKVYLNRWVQVRVITAKHSRYVWRTWYVAKRLLSTLEWYEYTPVIETPAVIETPVVEKPALEVPAEETTDDSDVNLEDIIPDLNSAPEESAEETTDDSAIDEEFSKLFEGI